MQARVRVALAVVLALMMTSASAYYPLSKRAYLDLKCLGVYDSSLFARLDRLCEDCHNLMRPRSIVYALCRQDCFTSEYFKACVEVLHETDELELFKSYIKQLHGASVDF